MRALGECKRHREKERKRERDFFYIHAISPIGEPGTFRDFDFQKKKKV